MSDPLGAHQKVALFDADDSIATNTTANPFADDYEEYAPSLSAAETASSPSMSSSSSTTPLDAVANLNSTQIAGIASAASSVVGGLVSSTLSTLSSQEKNGTSSSSSSSSSSYTYGDDDADNDAAADLETGDGGGGYSTRAGVSQRRIVAAHLLFKSLAVLLYMTASLLSSNFVIIFIILVLLLAVDFYVVKNISGRLLVGLRWWNMVREDGTTRWVYESAPASKRVHAGDARIFWWSTWLTPLVWLLFGVAALMSLKIGWLILVVIALSLSLANVVGYYKCKKDARQQLQSMATNYIINNM